MKLINLLIVDDEPMAHTVLTDYCKKLDYINIVEHCYDGVSALNKINTEDVDAILLDIQIPELTGLELAETINRTGKPKIIFTTSYTDYAVQSYQYDVVIDYLHKPIKFTRFLTALERLKRTLIVESASNDNKQQAPSDVSQAHCIYIKDGSDQKKVAIDHILFLQSYGNYLKYHTKDGNVILERQTISNAEKTLPQDRFCRIHKSYIVNLKYVEEILLDKVSILNKDIPIGKNYKALFKTKIDAVKAK